MLCAATVSKSTSCTGKGVSVIDQANPVETRPTSLPTLTGMRFVAATIVFLSHASFVNLFADQAFSQNFIIVFDQAGFGAVGYFFMLSGFIMTWSARPSDTPSTFWRRRVFRIWP